MRLKVLEKGNNLFGLDCQESIAWTEIVLTFIDSESRYVIKENIIWI